MTEEDRERLLELCKNEIYAEMLGTFYKHTQEDLKWWQDLKYQNPDEFEFVIRHAKDEYGWYRWTEGKDGRRVKMDVDTWVVLACTVGMFVVGVLLLAGVI